MSGMSEEYKSNPLIIPKGPPKPRVCPKCGSDKYTGRSLQGTVLFTCLVETCKTQWGGGLPHLPQDPTKPLPPMNPKDLPLVDFIGSKHESAVGGVREIRRAPSTVQPFRTGALVPEEED